MKFFSIHENPSQRDVDERVVLVKEGPIWAAFFLPVLWLIYKRAWEGLPLYSLAGALMLGLLGLLGVPGDLIKMAGGAFLLLTPALMILAPSPLLAVLGIVFCLICAYEAGDIYRFTLNRRGYRLKGTVAGRSKEEAEHRYFSSTERANRQSLSGTPESGGTPGGQGRRADDQGARRAGAWASASEPILGLFPAPDRRG